MKTRIRALLLCLLCGISYGQLPEEIKQDYKLVWDDDFNYEDKKLDKRWESQNGPSGHILCSRWRENVEVKDGLLYLKNKKENRGGQEWTSGSIWTKKKFKYGYFECRYKYAAAETTNNSFWLMTKGKDPKKGKRFEIDINEGHYPNEVNTNVHNHTDHVITKSGKKISIRNPEAFTYEDIDFSKDFHVFGLTWDENGMVYYLDGKEIRRLKNDFCFGKTPIFLSLALVEWYGTLTDAVDGTSMKVDYVRYYKKVK
ncbi:glycoside hydrolase family 16 protein [Flagellimonas sp. HMM57]|uniref:glycoside hydrolase family 16 protein n=1 Tax=unclassified Flagellimonas TaxID=2644544 RepID=UPI0013D12699|nr:MULTISPECIES: glycoside hydrolase family 16 protein [unclassified Flagellimonas]UII75359.1 glycoside hydrolase family 16 protein [Flagellimonas sp. HMM57]